MQYNYNLEAFGFPTTLDFGSYAYMQAMFINSFMRTIQDSDNKV